MDNADSRRAVELCYRTNKTLVNPIIDWTDEDVWEFIKGYKLPYCCLYDEGWKRLGCVGCPLASIPHRKAEFERWPGIKRMYIKAFDAMLQARIEAGLTYNNAWKDGETVMKWWLGELDSSEESEAEQTSFLEDEEEEPDEELEDLYNE